MGTQGPLNRDSLIDFKDEIAERSNKLRDEHVAANQPVVDAKNKNELQRRNVTEAYNQQRGTVTQKFYALINLTTGKWVLEEIQNNRPGRPDANLLFNDAAIAGKYNKLHVVSLEIFGSKEEALKKHADTIKAENDNKAS